jgi:cephalosporin-C deacetylase-like acetyl esterase
MANENDSDKDRFLYPIGKYYGEFTPENLAFDANIQEFAQRVSYLCGLETNGKIPTKEAYQEIKKLWKQLKESKQELFKDDESF